MPQLSTGQFGTMPDPGRVNLGPGVGPPEKSQNTSPGASQGIMKTFGGKNGGGAAADLEEVAAL
jgi:hypothetical protein